MHLIFTYLLSYFSLFFLTTSIQLFGYNKNAIPEAGETDHSLQKDPDISIDLFNINMALEALRYEVLSSVPVTSLWFCLFLLQHLKFLLNYAL